MKASIIVVILFLLFLLSWDIYSSAGIFIFILVLINFFQNTNSQIAFKEWVLLLYALNYLLAPAISLHIEQEKVAYQIKLNAEQYYTLVVPGFLCFYWGMNSIKTKNSGFISLSYNCVCKTDNYEITIIFNNS